MACDTARLVPFYINVNLFNIYVNLFHMKVRLPGRKCREEMLTMRVDDRLPGDTEGLRSTALAAAFSFAPALTVLGFIMAADLVLTMSGLVVDRRLITGAPAWLKPAKFALSTLIAAWSFAFCIASTTNWPRLTRALDLILAGALLLEIGLIDMQAARGTSSHFNLATRFDAAVFGFMGISIACIWLAMLLLTVVLFRQSFASSAWGWSLRLGMVLALVGTGSGGLMTIPSPQQLAAAHTTGRLPVAGSHTVGAPDGGRGLPVTGWSADHGDLRVAHFLGMHGLQVLPLLAWWIARRRSPPAARAQRNLIFAIAASYLAFFLLVLAQAFRGQSIVHPDKLTLEGFAVWILATGVAVIAIRAKPSHPHNPAHPAQQYTLR
jgi:hypothetical protein